MVVMAVIVVMVVVAMLMTIVSEELGLDVQDAVEIESVAPEDFRQAGVEGLQRAIHGKAPPSAPTASGEAAPAPEPVKEPS